MTCKDAINSDTSSEDKELYLLNEIRRSSKIFEFNLEGTNDQSHARIFASLIIQKMEIVQQIAKKETNFNYANTQFQKIIKCMIFRIDI